MARLSFEVPEVPPSVNHYKVPIVIRGRFGMKTSFMLTDQARRYKQLLAMYARGRTLAPATDNERRKVKYRLRVVVYLGPGARGDGDNFFKCVADGLVETGVIHSDAAVIDWHMYVRRADAGRTAITIWNS